jgi:predicted nucleic acid-binding protein
VIVADTSAVLALIDRGDRHHRRLKRLFEEGTERWILPSAILPEVDYLAKAHIGARAPGRVRIRSPRRRLRCGVGRRRTLADAAAIHMKYKNLRLGLVDAAVMATSVQLKAVCHCDAELNHFAAGAIPGSPKLFPRDLGQVPVRSRRISGRARMRQPTAD